MARQISNRDISPILSAAEHWIGNCLREDRAVFFPEDSHWTPTLAEELYQVFVQHVDFGQEDFMTKLKAQMVSASRPAQQLMAEMPWALLLFHQT